MEVNLNNLSQLCLGAYILGSGGGSHFYYQFLFARYQLEQYGPVPLINIENIEDEGLIVPLAFVGAPLVRREKLVNLDALILLVKKVEWYFGKTITALLPAEIGGSNVLTPFLIANKIKKPILNGDLIGRAFPEIQMCAPSIFNFKNKIAFLADYAGNVTVIKAGSMIDLEKKVRAIVTQHGSSMMIAVFIMNGKQAKRIVVQNSILHAIEIGKNMSVCYLASGIIEEIEQTIENGFLIGKIFIENKKQKIEIVFKNEYLGVYINQELIIHTPDIIHLLQKKSQQPISTEMLQKGAGVDIIYLRAPEIWYQEKAMQLVGPEYFNLKRDISYEI